jgi:hypothetical protein
MNEYEIGITFFGAGAAAMADHDIIFWLEVKTEFTELLW